MLSALVRVYNLLWYRKWTACQHSWSLALHGQGDLHWYCRQCHTWWRA